MHIALLSVPLVVMLACFHNTAHITSWVDSAQLGGRGQTVTSTRVRGEGQADSQHRGQALVWGAPIDGMRAALELVPHPETFTFGAVTGVRIHIQNLDSEPISFSTEGVRQDDEARVWNDVGKELVVSNIYHSGWPRTVQLTIRPGEEAVLNSGAFGIEESYEKARKFMDRVQNALVCPSGDYTILFEVHIGYVVLFDASGKQRVPAEGEWKGSLKTGRIPIRISR